MSGDGICCWFWMAASRHDGPGGERFDSVSTERGNSHCNSRISTLTKFAFFLV